MKKQTMVLALLVSLILPSIAFGLDGDKAIYQGGSVREKFFPGATKPVEGFLHTGNDEYMRFECKWEKSTKIYDIRYNQIIDLEYGQKAGRRVGMAVATTILLGPIGLLSLLSKKRKHFLTIGYRDDEGKDQVAVFELGKDIVRTTLSVVETRSGKQIEYQDEEAKKKTRGE
jgi:hypothetical protein